MNRAQAEAQAKERRKNAPEGVSYVAELIAGNNWTVAAYRGGKRFYGKA